jgi:hypothetical protein
MKTSLTQEQIDLLNKPLPQEALKQHPTKKFLSSINAIYVTERLNAVFGVGQWQTRVEVVDAKPTKPDRNNNVSTMVVTKTIFEVPEYGIHYECYGGNDNDDLGDAYKGSTTDAITKIASFLGIGAHVWKNQGTPNGKPLPQQPAKPQKTLRERIIEYLKKMEPTDRDAYLTYFQITDIDKLTDKQANDIAEFEKKKKAQEKKQ